MAFTPRGGRGGDRGGRGGFGGGRGGDRGGRGGFSRGGGRGQFLHLLLAQLSQRLHLAKRRAWKFSTASILRIL